MKRYALFVGINEYKDQSISRLRCAGNDAKALCMQFAKSGFETSTLLLNSEASCSRIADELSKMMEKISKGDLFVFYFAGHGILHNNAHHLVASEANINFKTGLFPVQNLLDHIGAEKEIHRMFILDCCRTDLQHGRGDSYTGEFSRKISLTGGMSGSVGFSPCITLCSCSHKEKAYEDVDHGYFTKAFLSTITDEKVKDFSDFQTMLQKNMASPHPQHIDWSGQLDLWKQVKLFPTWGKKAAAQTFAAPDEFYTILMQSEDQEKILKEKNLTISQPMAGLRRIANLAADRGDFTTAIKKLLEFISLAKEAIVAEEQRIAEAERLKKERIIAEEKRRENEKKFATALWVANDLTKKMSSMKINIPEDMLFLKRTAEVLKERNDYESAISKLEEYVSLAKDAISVEEKRLEKERKIAEEKRRENEKRYATVFSEATALTKKMSSMKINIPEDVSSLKRTAEVLKERNDYESAISKLEEFISRAKKAIVAEEQRIAEEKSQKTLLKLSPDGKTVTGVSDKNVTHIVIPSGVTSIGDWAFQRCSNLTSVDLPSGMTSIGDWAFADCSNLTSVEIPSSVTSIGECAFSDCSNLTSVKIPSSVTSIAKVAFYGCSSLASVEISSSVTSIGKVAFYGCSSLTSVEIPSSVTSIGEGAFLGCDKLSQVVISKGCDYCRGWFGRSSFPKGCRVHRK